MTYLLRYAMIVLSLFMILGTLAYFHPELLSRLGLWDAPGQLQSYYREKNRTNHLEDYNRSLQERRAKIHRIVQELCREEINLSEAACRVKDLEKENLPPLKWADIPEEKWPERLKMCLIEQVAFEFREEPQKAKRLLAKLEKEVQDNFGLSVRLEPAALPEQPKRDQAWQGPLVPVPR
jgi:hypothetical protein